MESDEKLDAKISVRITSALLSALKEEARLKRRSVNWVARDWLEEAAARRGRKKKGKAQ